MVRSRCALVVVTTLILALAGGCANGVVLDPPTPDGPRLTRLEARPVESMVGCPVELVFAFDAGPDDVSQAVAAWSRRLGRGGGEGRAILDVPAEAFADHRHGEAAARVVPKQSGRYVYFVQVEDRGGRKSNVLQTVVSVAGWWGGGC